MIKQSSIDKVLDGVQIEVVIGRHVELKRQGSSLVGCCPFHQEKSGSFHVNVSRQNFKCFGCGEGGNAISFKMKYNKLSFPDAIKELAEENGIMVEFEEDARISQEAKDLLQEMYQINNAASTLYRTTLLNLSEDHPAKVHLQQRGYSQETIVDFQIGFAPDQWRTLSDMIIENGKFIVASELGLVKSNQGSNYDFFKNRIMFPIHDVKGNIVAFGGRTLSEDKKDPKYLNSPESKIYKKSLTLYGLYQAQKAIRKEGFAILVEGYTDVISFHQAGIENAIASCGTAFTKEHAKVLKRYTDSVLLIGDSDAAGLKSNLAAIDILLEHDFSVKICPLPEGDDPDTFVRKNIQSEIPA